MDFLKLWFFIFAMLYWSQVTTNNFYTGFRGVRLKDQKLIEQNNWLNFFLYQVSKINWSLNLKKSQV